MALKHGTVAKYNASCRCNACRAANSEYRQQRRGGVTAQDEGSPQGTNRVEHAVLAEVGLAAHVRPGLAAVALSLARLLDNPRGASTHPAAAKTLATILDKLHQAGAPGRRENLSVVRTMTKKGGA